MECALVGRAVTKEAYAYLIGAPVAGGKTRADRNIMTRAHYAVRTQNALVAIRDMHRAAFALAIACGFSEQLCHHVRQISALCDYMTVSAMRAGNIIVVPQTFAHACCDSLLSKIQMHKAGYLALSEQSLRFAFKLADTHHPEVHIHHGLF